MSIPMMNPSKKSRSDNSFSSFAIGVSVGVVASLLFGTDEGRKLVQKVIDSVPEKYKNLPETPALRSLGEVGSLRSSAFGGSAARQSPPILDIPLQETPHHATYTEAPPPAAPHVRPSRPEAFIPS